MITSRQKLWLLPVLLILALFTKSAVAHEIRPALLEIKETSPGWFEVTWKVPMKGNMVLAIEPVLPPGLKIIGQPADKLIPGARVQRFTCTGDAASLIGQTIEIKGLSSLQIDVLLRINFADGKSHSAILRPSSSSYEIPALATKVEIAWSYTRMGVIHILEGFDHLLFLLALMLLIKGFGKLLKTITAFTIAHSLTLAAATLGAVNVPTGPTEAIIALSIVFLAAEIVRNRRGDAVLTAKYPWVVAFAFGLFHGLGFAGALSEIGVPQYEVPLALLMFNVGVEIGQVMFVLAVVGLFAVLKRMRPPELITWPSTRRVMPYAIGGVAAFWMIERFVTAFQISI